MVNLFYRFGSTLKTTENLDSICRWYNGTWKNGDFFSGLITNEDGELSPQQHCLSVWYNGIWENGIWYGGNFKEGIWKNGIWKNGIFGISTYANNNNNNNILTPLYVSQTNGYHYDNDWCYWSGSTINPDKKLHDVDQITSEYSVSDIYEWVNYKEIIEIDETFSYKDDHLSGITSNTLRFYFDKSDNLSLNSINYFYRDKFDFNDMYNNHDWYMVIYYDNTKHYLNKTEIINFITLGDNYENNGYDLTVSWSTRFNNNRY